MLHYFQHHTDKLLEVTKPLFMGILSILFVSWTDIEQGLKILVLVSTFGYSIWKWRKEYKDAQKPVKIKK